MSDDSTKIGKTKLTYSCQKGDECSAPKEQNMLVVHGIEDGKYTAEELYNIL